jgi:DNA polymerase-3 subunit gamma/tau
MTTLYRKYRPQTFASLVGQDYIVRTLTNELLSGAIAHAYLFYGPRGTGKTTTARLLAKAINCTKRQPDSFEPCDTCTSCQEITTGRSLDVIEIDAASQTGVDNVRENIIENAQFKPTVAKYKIFIIDEVHMLSTSAFNALLKTLEEPPAHVVFILATTELTKLPATVISRCQRFTFKKIPHDVMKTRLNMLAGEEKITVENEVLERVIIKSDGCLRDAESLLGQIFSLAHEQKVSAQDIDLLLPSSNRESILAFLLALSEKNTTKTLETLEAALQDGQSGDQIIIKLIEVLRSALMLKAGGKPEEQTAEYSTAEREKLIVIIEKLTIEEIVRLIELALKRKQDSRNSPIPQLPLELLAVEFCCNLAREEKAPPTASQPFTPPAKIAPTPVVTFAKLPTTPPAVLPSTPKIPPPTPEIKTTTTQPAEPTPPQPTTTGSSSEILTKIQQSWHNSMERVSAQSHSLTFILNTSKAISCVGSTVTIGVAYDFHREKLMELKNRKVIEQVLSDQCGERILIDCVVDTKGQTNSPNAEPDLSALAADFGGAVVG